MGLIVRGCGGHQESAPGAKEWCDWGQTLGASEERKRTRIIRMLQRSQLIIAAQCHELQFAAPGRAGDSALATGI